MQIVSILNNNGQQARVQLDDGSIIDGVVILYPFGLFSNIAISDNSMGLLLKDGASDYPYVMPFNISAQPTLASSEVAIGNFEKNIKFLQNGKIEINGDVIINGSIQTTGRANLGENIIIAGTLKAIGASELTGDTLINGKLEVVGQAKLQGKDFITHIHSGVQTGSSNSGSVV
jgi:hypothetical protein